MSRIMQKKLQIELKFKVLQNGNEAVVNKSLTIAKVGDHIVSIELRLCKPNSAPSLFTVSLFEAFSQDVSTANNEGLLESILPYFVFLCFPIFQFLLLSMSVCNK